MGSRGRLLRIGVAAAIVVTAGVTWRLLDEQRSTHVQALIDREITFAGDVLLRDLRARFAAISHMAHLWERGTPPSAAQFYADAEGQMDRAPGLFGIGYADPAHVLQWTAPSAVRPLEGRSVVASPERAQAMRDARASRDVRISPPLTLMDGSGTGFLMYVPLFEGETFHGTLLGVFHAELWLRSLFSTEAQEGFLPNFALRLSLQGEILLESPDFDTTPPEHLARTEVTWNGAPLLLEARPRAAFFADRWHWAPESLAAIVLLTLSALAALVSLVQRAQLAEASAQAAAFELLDLNASLREEAEVRRQAEAEAQTARAATSRFLATMSHEIRTPLNAIIGMFQLIEAATDVPARQRRQAAKGVEAARRLHRDLSNVLDISRIDAGALRVHRGPTDLIPLAQGWSAALEGFVTRSGRAIACRVEMAPDLPDHAVLDAAALTQVVNNLMDNAVKFTEAGTISLRVWRDGTRLGITVSDTGLGIADDRKASIFQRFYQVEGGIERRFSGTGLGLAICRDLVELMEGTIEVRDNFPRGAIFEVTLQDALAADMPADGASAPSAGVPQDAAARPRPAEISAERSGPGAAERRADAAPALSGQAAHSMPPSAEMARPVRI